MKVELIKRKQKNKKLEKYLKEYKGWYLISSLPIILIIQKFLSVL